MFVPEATTGGQKFTRKERDNETGLDYFEARYYSSVQGRFTSVDALLSSGVPGEPQSWNRYSYTINNPLKFIDPSGLIWVYQDSPGIRSFRWYDDEKDVPKGWTEYTGAYYDGADGRYYLNPNGPEGDLYTRERTDSGLITTGTHTFEMVGQKVRRPSSTKPT